MNQVATHTPQSLWTALHLEDGAGRWLPPATRSPTMLAQAKAVLAAFPPRLQAAATDTKRKWLVSLGALCAGRMPLQEAEARVSLYADMLDHPEGCFTRGTLQTIGAQFTWFPSFAEIKGALDAERIRLGKEHARLQRLLAPQAIMEGPRPPPTPEQIERVDKALREAGLKK